MRAGEKRPRRSETRTLCREFERAQEREKGELARLHGYIKSNAAKRATDSFLREKLKSVSSSGLFLELSCILSANLIDIIGNDKTTMPI